jgi:hypothetical protein
MFKHYHGSIVVPRPIFATHHVLCMEFLRGEKLDKVRREAAREVGRASRMEGGREGWREGRRNGNLRLDVLSDWFSAISSPVTI